MSATLVAHKGAVRVSRAELATIEPPAATKTWKPVTHAELVRMLTEQLYVGNTQAVWIYNRRWDELSRGMRRSTTSFT